MVDPDGAFRVVTTVTADDEGATVPIRAVAMLRPGQATILSTPGPLDTAPAEVVFERRGDRLVVDVRRRQTASVAD